jgi:mannosyltransferase
VSTSEYPAPGLSEPRSSAFAVVRAISADVWLLTALVVLAAVIRIVTLDNQSLWADEALTAYEVRLPFGAMWHTVASVETTPPLYFVLIWAWAKVFGGGAVALRAFSAIAGVAIVPIAYAAARELVSRRAGVLAAAFVAINPLMLWYSQEARSYMLLAAFSGASFLFFARARRDPSPANLAGWAGLSAAALMTHFFAGFLVAPEALWLLVQRRSLATGVAVAVVAAAQAAMLPFVFADATAAKGVGWIAKSPQLNRIATTVVEWGASNLYRRTTTPGGLAFGVALALAVVLLLVAGKDRRARRGAGVAAAIAASVFVAPFAFAQFGQDYFLSRNVIPAFIPVVTVLAAACVAPQARAAGAVLAVALLAVFGITAVDVQTHPYLQRPDWRAVAAALGPASRPRAILAADGATADALKIYLPGVSWTWPPGRRVLVSEIDVVGATKRLLLATPAERRGELVEEKLGEVTHGSTVPRRAAPPGARLLARFRVRNWIVARFALDHPQRVSVNRLIRIASRFFRRTPASLLVFTQPRAR